MNRPNPDPLPDRAQRQRDLVPPERLAACDVLVIGVGAIGRQLALQLTALGVPRLVLYDHDTVETVNLAPQGYYPDQIGQLKVEATAADCRRLNPLVEVLTRAERFQRRTAGQAGPSHGSRIAFVCVDSIATRQRLWQALRSQVELIVDGRLSAEVIRVLAVDGPATDTHYATTLFEPAEAYAGPCTARSTIYTASIAAGLMVGQFTRWLRHLPVDAELTFNLLASECTVSSGQDPIIPA